MYTVPVFLRFTLSFQGKRMKRFFRTCPRDDEQGRVAVETLRKLGYKMVMTSTQANEQAQHFYRKLVSIKFRIIDSVCCINIHNMSY